MDFNHKRREPTMHSTAATTRAPVPSRPETSERADTPAARSSQAAVVNTHKPPMHAPKETLGQTELQRVARQEAAEQQIGDLARANATMANIVQAVRGKASYEDLVEIIATRALADQANREIAPPAAAPDMAKVFAEAFDVDFGSLVKPTAAPALAQEPTRHLEATPAKTAAPAVTAPAVTTKGFRETPQHTAIFQAMSDESRGAIIEAVAGSGKSTTMVEGARRILSNPNDQRNFRFLVFNRSVAKDLNKKINMRNATATTFHSMAWGLVSGARNWGSIEYIKDSRVQDAAFHVAKNEIGGKKVGQDSKDLKQVWSLALATMTPMNEPGLLRKMAQEYGSSVDQKSPVFYKVKSMDDRLRSDTSSISYDEMLREVVEKRLQPPRADIVVVDEAQDLNRIQIEMLKQMNPSKVIAVGDRKQAIYAFRGADSRAMDRLASEFEITNQLPLSTTHRCAKSIVIEAQHLVPAIQAKEDAADGHVDHRPVHLLRETIRSAQPGDLVIGRNNKPLVDAFFERRSVADQANVAIVGSDIGKEMKSQINKAFKATGSEEPTVLSQFIMETAEERASLMERNGSSAAADNIRDEAATTIKILSEVDSKAEAEKLIDGMFVESPAQGAINFSTVHKSKGLEAERVIFLGPNLIPSRKAIESKNQTLIEQENNLLYVGITRARTELVMQEMDDGGAGKKR